MLEDHAQTQFENGQRVREIAKRIQIQLKILEEDLNL